MWRATMSHFINRRYFLAQSLKVSGLIGLTDLGLLSGDRSMSNAEAEVSQPKVQLNSEIEPVVRLIEDTPRNKLVEEVALKIRNDKLSYDQILTGLFLAGVRDIEPRPVGFKFHAVMVVNSTHLASLAAENKDRWLPLFWALDNFKAAQLRNTKEGGWFMTAVDQGKLPSQAKAKEQFVEAIENWDVEKADRAATSLVRNTSAEETIELFWRYCGRDFRDIGHKVIYTANAWRTLQSIGWHHAETVARSLAYALLDHDGGNPSKADAAADRPGRENLLLVEKIRTGWQQGKVDASIVPNFLTVLRTASPSEASQNVVELLNKQVDPSSIWDGLLLQATELLLRQPGILGVHCVTSMNAFHYAFQTSTNAQTRRFLLLQATAFLPLFRELLRLGVIASDEHVDKLAEVEMKVSQQDALDQIFVDVNKNAMQAACKTLAYLKAGGDPRPLIATARRLILIKGDEAHDYKFSAAVFEDFYSVSPHWRNNYLAASMFYLRGSHEHNNALVKRIQAALV
jgi:hypothetical protein